MDKFRITGGRALSGRVTISGAKNSALPCMAAAILTAETVTLHNVPYVRDCLTQRRLLEDLGATVLVPDLRTHKITASHIELFEAPYELVKTMRASVLALGQGEGLASRRLRHRHAPHRHAPRRVEAARRAGAFGVRLRRRARAEGR